MVAVRVPKGLRLLSKVAPDKEQGCALAARATLVRAVCISTMVRDGIGCYAPHFRADVSAGLVLASSRLARWVV